MGKSEKLEGRAGVAAALGIGGVLAIGSVGFRFIYGSEADLIDAGYSALTQKNCKTKINPEKLISNTPFDSITNPLELQPQENAETIPPSNELLFHDYVREQADRFGLTLIDNSETLSALTSLQNIDDMVEEINDFTSANYGFSTEVPTGFNFKDLPNLYKSFNKDAFDKEEFRKIMKGLVRSIHSVPVEVVKLANLNRLVITDNNSFDLIPGALAPEKSPGVVYYPPKDIMYIELRDDTKSAFQYNFDFSLSAAIDISICGFAQEQLKKEIDDPNLFENSNITSSNQAFIDVESLTVLKDEIKGINNKAKIFRNYIAPRTAIDLSGTEQSDIDSSLLQVLRINEHVPGYANFWESLTYKSNENSENIMLDDSLQDLNA